MFSETFSVQVWSEVISEPDTDTGSITAQLSVTEDVKLSDWNREITFGDQILVSHDCDEFCESVYWKFSEVL